MRLLRCCLPLLSAVVLAAGCDCRQRERPVTAAVELSLWHTFNPEETPTLNRLLDESRRAHPRWRIRATVIPFARAQNGFRRAAASCKRGAPDLFRAELPWVAEFVDKRLLQPVPASALAEQRYLPAARAASRYRGKRWALPASVDGLALLYRRDLLRRPPRTIDELVRAARRLTVDRQGRHPGDRGFDRRQVVRWGFYVRAEGYWFLPFLWAFGGRLLDPASGEVFVDRPAAVKALRFYRDLVRVEQIAPPAVRLSNDYEDQLQRFGRGELAMMVNGPWATSAILDLPVFSDAGRLGVAPFPRGPSGKPAAPRSHHGFVVSRCSRHPAAAWRLAEELAGREAQARFAREAGLLPVLRAVYDAPQVRGSRIVRAFGEALHRARNRPQHPVMARIFDDFTPAVQSVLLGESAPTEALAGVARAWRRLLRPTGGPPR